MDHATLHTLLSRSRPHVAPRLAHRLTGTTRTSTFHVTYYQSVFQGSVAVLAERRASHASAGSREDKPPQQGLKPRTLAPRVAPPSRHTGQLQLDWRSAPKPPAGVDLNKFAGRLLAPPANDQLPRLNALVVVEGFNDCLALHRAVRAPAFVLGGGYAVADAMRPELRYLAALATAGLLPRTLVVFTDPDWQGRMFRTYLEDLFHPFTGAPAAPVGAAEGPAAAEAAGAVSAGPAVGAAGRGRRATGLTASGAVGGDASAPPEGQQQQGRGGRRAVSPERGLVVRHAFLAVELGTSEEDSGRHEAGNVGVEHASPAAIQACLRRARPGFGPTRADFTIERLQADGLVGSWSDKEKVAGPKLRRVRFCRALGIDEVGNGKALAKVLNRFFSAQEYAAALAAAEAGLQEEPARAPGA